MKIARRLTVPFVFAAIVLFVGILFWPFILNSIIQPTALVVWLLLRILVLSIDQKYFWYTAIFVAIFFLFRLLPREQPGIQPEDSPQTNATMNRARYWRTLFEYSDENIRDEKTFKRELIRLLTSFYASKQRISNSFGIYEALQQGELPLPENIHNYLFPQDPLQSDGWIKRFFRSIRATPRKWIRQWSGQEKAEHDRMIDEVLNYLETSLEIKNDDRKYVHNEH